MTTGEKIREARKRVNLTQKQLGELIGVSGAMIGQYETGIRNPKTETLKKLAKPLCISWFELYGDSKEQLEAIQEDIDDATKKAPVQNVFTEAFFDPDIRAKALALAEGKTANSGQKNRELVERTIIASYLSGIGIEPPNLETLISVGFKPNEAFLIMYLMSVSEAEKRLMTEEMKREKEADDDAPQANP